jgi:hypothetical protein
MIGGHRANLSGGACESLFGETILQAITGGQIALALQSLRGMKNLPGLDAKGAIMSNDGFATNENESSDCDCKEETLKGIAYRLP